jgi:hypothetical protein
MTFDFSKLEVRQSVAWVAMPELSEKARIAVKPATEANAPYFNAMLRRSAARARRMARTDRITAEDAAANRSDDRDIYPRYILVNWEHVYDTDGKLVPFNEDNCREFCSKLPDWLFDRLRQVATTPERFLDEHGEEDPDPEALAGN